MKHSVAHKTVVVKKTVPFPVSEVYSAFASVKARARWSVPKGDAMEYRKSSFRIGGEDVFRCGSPGKLEYRGRVQYHEIIKNKRILSTETMAHLNHRISVALLTTEFRTVGRSTEIVITAQISSLDGVDMSKGYKQGWTSVLGNLVEYLKN